MEKQKQPAKLKPFLVNDMGLSSLFRYYLEEKDEQPFDLEPKDLTKILEMRLRIDITDSVAPFYKNIGRPFDGASR